MKLTKDQIYEIRDQEPIEINGEEYEYHTELEEEMNDHGRSVCYIYTRNGKYYLTTLFWVRYGYKDYGLDPDFCDREFIEVERKEVCNIDWVAV